MLLQSLPGFRLPLQAYIAQNKLHRVVRRAMATEHEVVHPEIPRIQPAQLAAQLTESSSKVLVVDVRGEDFGDHVKGAVNLPVDQLKDANKIDQIVKDVLLAHPAAETAVFYCGRSQHRGPTGAAKFLEALTSQGATGPQVLVLEGGIKSFEATHPELIQK